MADRSPRASPRLYPNRRLLARATRRPHAARKEYDCFICHASEDKDFVRPLADALRTRGKKVWYDDFVLNVGDSLRRSIDSGLAQSRFGIVVLSESFFSKHWPQQELDGLAAREGEGNKVILPVWHNIDQAQVRKSSPMLADRVATFSSLGVDAVADKLIMAMDGKDVTGGD